MSVSQLLPYVQDYLMRSITVPLCCFRNCYPEFLVCIYIRRSGNCGHQRGDQETIWPRFRISQTAWYMHVFITFVIILILVIIVFVAVDPPLWS
jgi:hypothetical protein